MTDRTSYQDSDTKLPDTTTGTRSLLITVSRVTVTEFGIRLYFEPSGALRFVKPLPAMQEKDLHYSPIIHPDQDSMLCGTKKYVPEIYLTKRNEFPDEDLMRLIPKAGEAVFEVTGEINLPRLK